MRQRILAATVLATVLIGPSVTQAAEDAQAILGKAIKAIGGEEKLGKAIALKWSADGKLTIDGNDNDFAISYTTQGIDHIRSDFNGEFNGNTIKGTTVLDGKKGWRSFGETNPLDDDAVANEQRNAYLQVVPITLVALKDKAFETEATGEEKVGDKLANVVKVTGPDGKTFRLLFDKESNLLVKLTATVAGFGGDDYDQVCLYKDYKEMGGIQKASVVEVLRNGDPFLKVNIKSFQVVEKLPTDAFAEPK